jgi:hypothetical protein
MSAVEDFHQQLQAARAKLAEAKEIASSAVDLLKEARRAIVTAHAQADHWVPPQLEVAIERLGTDVDRLSSAGDLLGGYEARL